VAVAVMVLQEEEKKAIGPSGRAVRAEDLAGGEPRLAAAAPWNGSWISGAQRKVALLPHGKRNERAL